MASSRASASAAGPLTLTRRKPCSRGSSRRGTGPRLRRLVPAAVVHRVLGTALGLAQPVLARGGVDRVLRVGLPLTDEGLANQGGRLGERLLRRLGDLGHLE